jgi:hypothetical protein
VKDPDGVRLLAAGPTDFDALMTSRDEEALVTARLISAQKSQRSNFTTAQKRNHGIRNFNNQVTSSVLNTGLNTGLNTERSIIGAQVALNTGRSVNIGEKKYNGQKNRTEQKKYSPGLEAKAFEYNAGSNPPEDIEVNPKPEDIRKFDIRNVENTVVQNVEDVLIVPVTEPNMEEIQIYETQIEETKIAVTTWEDQIGAVLDNTITAEAFAKAMFSAFPYLEEGALGSKIKMTLEMMQKKYTVSFDKSAAQGLINHKSYNVDKSDNERGDIPNSARELLGGRLERIVEQSEMGMKDPTDVASALREIREMLMEKTVMEKTGAKTVTQSSGDQSSGETASGQIDTSSGQIQEGRNQESFRETFAQLEKAKIVVPSIVTLENKKVNALESTLNFEMSAAIFKILSRL